MSVPAEAIGACTVVSRSHLARAVALANSLAQHHPDVRLHALVTDADRTTVPTMVGALVIRRPCDLVALDRAEYHRMAAIYSPFELACALKPHIMQTLHAEGADAVLYLDGDMLVLAPIDDIFDAALRHGLALTPHLRTATDATPGALALEDTIRGAGWINGGLIATGPRGRTFLDWWAARLARDCRVSRPGGIVDQAPLALAPGLFSHVLVDDPGINTAWWTLAGDDAPPDADRLAVGGRLVRVLHLSGYDPAAPYRFSAYDSAVPAASLAENAPLRAECDRYAAALATAGDAELQRLPYGFGHLASGGRYDTRMRALYDHALAEHERGDGPPPPNPFADDGGAAFVAWLREPVGPIEPMEPVSRYLHHIWATGAQLQARFPDLDANAPDFLRHCVSEAHTLEIPHDLLPPVVPAPHAPVTAGTLVLGMRDAHESHTALEEAVAQALAATGERVVQGQVQVHGDLTQCTTNPRVRCGVDTALLAVDAPAIPAADAVLGNRLRRSVPRVGLALWHGSDVPSGLTQALSALDDVWAPSEWAAGALVDAGLPAAWIAPLPVLTPVPTGIRARLGLGGALLVHTVAGWHDRPEIAVDAFMRAFPPDADAALVIRLTTPPDTRPRERLLQRAGWREDVVVLTDCTRRDAEALLAESDCVIATDPATPTGHTVARAMAAGALVIAPGTSGDATHLRHTNGVILGPGDPIAHVRAIARHLRAVHERPNEWTAHRAAAAAALASHTPARIGAALVTRLATLRQT